MMTPRVGRELRRAPVDIQCVVAGHSIGVGPDNGRRLILGDVLVMPIGGLGGRSEQRLLELAGFPEARRELVSAHLACRDVLSPSGARQITSHDELDRERLGFSHKHRPAAQITHPHIRQVCSPVADEVIGNVREVLEPVSGESRQHHSLVRDHLWKNNVVRRNTISRHQQQMIVVHLEELTNLARADVLGCH